MFIQFSKEQMHVQVLCGILEKYQPTEELKEIHAKVAELKELMQKFRDESVTPALAEIEKLVKEENDKQAAKHSKKNA